MQLTCPQCNQPVSAADINIQQLVAICTGCDNIFSFSSDFLKSKRRKARQPEYLGLREADDLRISFRSNFRLDKNENFISSSIMTIVFTSIALLMFGLREEENTPVVLPIAFALTAAFAAYWLALIAYNKTHIVMDSSKIQVSRGPLPSYGQEREIELNNVVSIFSEETTRPKGKVTIHRVITSGRSWWTTGENSSSPMSLTTMACSSRSACRDIWTLTKKATGRTCHLQTNLTQ